MIMLQLGVCVISAGLIGLLGCSKVESRSYDEQNQMEDIIYFQNLANRIYDSFYSPVTKAESRSISTVEALRDSAAFVINFRNGGFVIVLNNTKGTPVAVCENGHLSAAEEAAGSNLVLSSILDNLGRNFGGDVFHPTKDDSISTLIETHVVLDSTIVTPIIDVQWHQKEPFNLFVPNGSAGCVPVAIAQAISVFSSPTTISLTYTNTPVSSVSLSWSDMKAPVHALACFSFSSHNAQACAYCQQCGYLLRQLGELTSVHYESSGASSSSYVDMSSPLSYLGYSCSFGTYSVPSVLSSLNSGYPTIIIGTTVDGIGHAYNADAYKKYTKTYDLFSDESGQLFFDSHNVESDTYLHLCYGQQLGLFNGYYLAQHTEYMAPHYGNPVYTENNTLRGKYWNNNLELNYNIHPINL